MKVIFCFLLLVFSAQTMAGDMYLFCSDRTDPDAEFLAEGIMDFTVNDRIIDIHTGKGAVHFMVPGQEHRYMRDAYTVTVTSDDDGYHYEIIQIIGGNSGGFTKRNVFKESHSEEVDITDTIFCNVMD